MKILGVTPDHFFILGYPDRGLRTMVDNPDAVVRSRGTRAHEVPYDDALSPGSQYKIENALNDHYNEVVGYPSLRANFRAGMRFRLGGE